MDYRVALWRTTLSPLPSATIPVQAEDAARAAQAAMQHHKAECMGAVVVMNSEGQQTYYDARLAGERITFSRDAWSPRPDIA